MLWGIVFLVVALAACVSACLGIVLAQDLHGYPVGRDFVQQVARRRDERRFAPADVCELDEAFHRVLCE